MITIPYRTDCAERYNAIKESMGDVNGKSLIDIGCANGYFMSRFLNDGGSSAVGVEPDENESSIAKGTGHSIFRSIEDVVGNFDFGLYLDLHFAYNIDYLDFCKNRVGVLFAATSGDGERMNEKFLDELSKHYKNIRAILKTGYANRRIFRCE